ncbi:TAXI family TRAP transporter solute-binding subunit [Halalkalibacter akibai]|uniref:TRAP transporter solute receptor n=1 Tax=Halalkalibacter akibai (strain ATCC 43226 / DSM 21942 / CIP 109018 / JCM 9157 / 1139) TaxID=1236973 RepID=W4QUM6_HALA3|nr:TAXI family TRAP transporter solute-binding subunit [Halalkalibacter akibai]GAE35029.1 TRAP transporter solute receptor [Halalkalibacter akibai JCM 9157]
MRTWFKTLILSVLMLTLLAACGSEDSGGSSDSTIVIGTAGSAGTFYAVGAGMSQVINNHSENLTAVSQGTNGATENVRLLNSGSIHVGFGNWDALYFGHTGQGPFNGEEQGTMSLMNLYLSGGQMVVRESSDIQSFEDLKGKRINLGPPGSTITDMSMIILREYGIDPEDDINPYFLDFGEGGRMLRDGDLDATFYVAGIPTAGVIDLSSSSKIRMLSLDENKRESIIDQYPYYDKLTIPAGTYNGVDYEVETLQLWTALMVNEELSEDVAYEIVSTLMENIDKFKDVHNVGADFSLENAALSIIPIHPGAEKYYREKGVLD